MKEISNTVALRFQVARAFGPRRKMHRRVFDARAIDVRHSIFASVCSDMRTELVEIDGKDDHVHLLMSRQLCRRRYPSLP